MSNYQFTRTNPGKTGRSMRKMIGILAFALPTILLVLSLNSNVGIQTSISHFNFTNAREIFTGILAAVGLMMLCYKTQPDFYDYIGSLKYKTEQRLAIAAGIFALGVALFPTNPIGYYADNIDIQQKMNPHFVKDVDQFTFNAIFDYTIGNLTPGYNKVNAIIHTGSATILFSILAVFCLYIFHTPKKVLKNLDDPIKKYLETNNLKYMVSSVLIISGILLAFLGNLLLDTNNNLYYTTLIGEVIALYAFGFSWFVKGREEEFLDSYEIKQKFSTHKKEEAEYA